MNSLERVMHRLRGEIVDRPPNFNIIMGYGVHQIGEKLSHYLLDYRVLCQMNLAMLEDLKLDIVQVISDPYREAADWGLDVEFPEDGLPIRKKLLLVDYSDLDKLHPIDPANGKRMGDRLQAVRLLHDQVAGEVPVMGWVEGALAEANNLRGVSAMMVDLIDEPGWCVELLERCCQLEIAFARMQVDAGADIIGLGDAIASQVSPKMYQKYALPYEQRIFAAVHQMGALARLHICGDTSRILSDMVRSGADIIDIDWMVDIHRAADIFGNGPAVCGNMDPVQVMYYGTTEQVIEGVRCCLENGGKRLFSTAGCEIPDGTPRANLLAQHQVLTSFFNQQEN